MYFGNTKGGISILGVLIIGILIVFALNYFHISIQVVVNPSTQGNQAQDAWTTYIQKPIQTIWNEFIVPYIWNPILQGINELKSGQFTNSLQTPSMMPAGQSQ